MNRKKYLLCSLSLLVFACGEKKVEKGAEPNAAESGTTAAMGAEEEGGAKAWKDIELPELGLIANAPGDSTLSKLGGISGLNYKCQAMIKEKGNMTPSYDSVLKNAQGSNAGGFKEMIQNEKTDDDNFVIEWTTNGDKFGYASRRTIGEKIISCNRVSSDKDGHECVMKVCASLKAK